jgi:very-short-patch-repair endonuclease
MDCKICEFVTNTNVGLAQHVSRLHKISFLNYKLEYEKLIIPKCICGKEVKVDTKNKGIRINLTCDNPECARELRRRGRLKFMKDHPEQTAWRLSNLSYPEKIFKQKCEELKLHEKHLIIREKSVYPYFIDFAFENEKIAVEIDGAQHTLKERIESDLRKDAHLISEGWRVIRFTASQVQKNIDYCINIILEFLNTELKYKTVGLYDYKEYKKESDSIKLREVGIRKEIKKRDVEKTKRDEERIINCGLTNEELSRAIKQRKVGRPDYNTLINFIQSNGYSATGRKYGVSDNAIRKWIKTYEKYGK